MYLFVIEIPFPNILLIFTLTLKDVPSHSHGHFVIEDKEKNKTIVIFSSSLYIPKWQTSRANVMSSLKNF